MKKILNEIWIPPIYYPIFFSDWFWVSLLTYIHDFRYLFYQYTLFIKEYWNFLHNFLILVAYFFFVFTESNQIGVDASAKAEGDDSSEVEPEAESGGVCGLKIWNILRGKSR